MKRPKKYTSRKGWRSHPAVLMWEGYEVALRQYYNLVVDEWVARGYNNTMRSAPITKPVTYPKWLGWDVFHKSHQSNLVRKDADYYKSTFPGVSPDLPYVWPE